MAEFDKYTELEKLRRQFEKNTRLMQAIGNESRQRILIAIMEGSFGGSRVGDIAAKAHLSEPAVSHHLKILRDAGVVTVYSRGTMNFYYIDAGSKEFDELVNLVSQFKSVAGEFAKIQNYGEEF